MTPTRSPEAVTLFLAGDVMTGRGIDQILPHPADPHIYESYVRSAKDYVLLAERRNGPIPQPVSFEYVWGDALDELNRRRLDARIINLETAITNSASAEPKGINYKMSPANVGVIRTAGIDCCVLANNHILDWGPSGLLETLHTLNRVGVQFTGAGCDAARATAPAIVDRGNSRLFVFSLACVDSGVPHEWAAGSERPGINLVPALSGDAAEEIIERIHTAVGKKHPVIVSIHWGGNWGYPVPEQHRLFAYRLIDAGCVDVIHGHSSHHAKGIEVYRGKLILYGCGDLINDYEGIEGWEQYRSDLALMYFPAIRTTDGSLAGLEMTPLQIRNMRLNRAARTDVEHLARILNREGKVFGTEVLIETDNTLKLKW
ncbi:CapA family protein [Hyphomicrobium sp. 99]|uniref:CapA family protein n=1 Tax=Hyphomicrobium sp. 99 TaxID=1163419 RepID=UPI0005F84A67|nr:CapA family protein [Hyphomicrobium sp. 99]